MIEKDDLLNHRALGADLMKMENEKHRLALFDELTDSFAKMIVLVGKLPADLTNHTTTGAVFHAYDVLDRARALQK